jgi:hypothetical protein
MRGPWSQCLSSYIHALLSLSLLRTRGLALYDLRYGIADHFLRSVVVYAYTVTHLRVVLINAKYQYMHASDLGLSDVHRTAHFLLFAINNEEHRSYRWTFLLQVENDAGWSAPTQRCEVPPYASIVARLGESEVWIAKMMQRIDWACDSFALRPPSNVKGHTAALHWGSRLKNTDVGGIPKLTPLSVRGPHVNGSAVFLSRLLSNSTHLISRARQGVGMMHLYPFAKPEVAALAN